MCIDGSRPAGVQRGITLVELIVFLVIVSVGIAGILSVMNVVVKSSADPIVNKQAAAMAEAILEEIMTKDYAPNAAYPQPAADTCPDRMLADDVDDYANCNGTAFIAGNATLGADPAAVAGLAAYRATVAVAAPAAVDGVTMKRITVTVANAAGLSFSLSGYKAGY